MSRNSKMQDRKNWAVEKHLKNARRVRGVYFIEREDEELKEMIKNARKKLEVPAAPALPCKKHKVRATCRIKDD